MPRERAQILSSLQVKGFVLQEGRDHDFLFLRHNGLTRAIFTKLSRGKQYREYSDNLLAKVARQLQLTRSQLNELVDCSMDGHAYLAVLSALGVLTRSREPGRRS